MGDGYAGPITPDAWLVLLTRSCSSHLLARCVVSWVTAYRCHWGRLYLFQEGLPLPSPLTRQDKTRQDKAKAIGAKLLE